MISFLPVLHIYIDNAEKHNLLNYDNHTEIFKITLTASSNWTGIGRQLGFKEDELSAIGRENGRTGEEDYYSAMLRKWLDWAPPNHRDPSVQQLSSALRAVGREKQASDLDAKYS